MCQYRAAKYSTTLQYSACARTEELGHSVPSAQVCCESKNALKRKKTKGFRGIYWKVLCTRAVYLKMWSVLGAADW